MLHRRAGIAVRQNHSLNKTSHVGFTPVDANGKTVAVIANETKAVGTYSLSLPIAGLSHGMYYLKLTTDSEMKTVAVAAIVFFMLIRINKRAITPVGVMALLFVVIRLN